MAERELVACVPVAREWWERSTGRGKAELIGQLVEQVVQVGQQLAASQGLVLHTLRAISAVPMDEAEERELWPELVDPAAFVLLRGLFTTVPMPKVHA